jgi:UDP-N-acetylglucosamine 2-epimerase (non-hydrolysing)
VRATSPRRPVAILIGTRPEAIKLAPVIRAFEEAGAPASVFLTGQHVQMVEPVLADLRIAPVENLNVMKPGQSLGDLSARLLSGLQSLFLRHRPGAVVVQGDTTTVAMGALSGFYLGIPIAHVEAGLRTGDSRNPFPEEANRRLVACLASLHFAPTERARQNLLRENIPDARIRVVGNTVIDALFHSRSHLLPSLPPEPRIDAILASGRPLVLVTAHRRESLGADLVSLCHGIRDLATAFGDAIVVFPVHLNPGVQSVVRQHLGAVPNVRLLDPLPYLRFVQLLLATKLVITDSGGVQEEAAALGIPFLVARWTTERPEGVEAGVGELVGPDAGRLLEATHRLLTDEAEYRRRAVPTRAFGDGSAAEQIARAVIAELQGGIEPAVKALPVGTCCE